MKYYLGIDLGGTNITAGVVDENCNLVFRFSEKTPQNKPVKETVAFIANTAKKAIELNSMKISDMEAIGIAAPGIINPNTSIVVNASNLNWHNVPLFEELKPYFDIPLYIGNDADCAALGETLAGAAKDHNNVIMVTLGTGIGGGIIMDKKIFCGADGMGAEIGHTKLVYGGVKCACGQFGCFEAYGSATALIRQTRQAIADNPESMMAKEFAFKQEKIDAKTCFNFAAKKDAAAIEVINSYVSYLAAGISTLVALFRPEVVIIGGGVSNAGDKLIKPLNKKLCTLTFAAGEIGVPPVIRAALGSNAGIIGAAMLPLHSIKD